MKLYKNNKSYAIICFGLSNKIYKSELYHKILSLFCMESVMTLFFSTITKVHFTLYAVVFSSTSTVRLASFGYFSQASAVMMHTIKSKSSGTTLAWAGSLFEMGKHGARLSMSHLRILSGIAAPFIRHKAMLSLKWNRWGQSFVEFLLKTQALVTQISRKWNTILLYHFRPRIW